MHARRKMARFSWLLALPLAALWGVAGVTGADEHEDKQQDASDRARDVLAVAYDFAEAVFAGDADTIREMASERLADVLAGPDGKKIRDGLSRQLGAVTGQDAAWLEDENQDLRRFRVPVAFERGAFDARVVIDTHKQVVGFFMVPPKARPPVHAAGAHADHAQDGHADDGRAHSGHAHADHPGHSSAGRVDDSVDPPPGVREIALEVGAGESSLPARLSVPADGGPLPAVVLVHDAGAVDRNGPEGVFRSLAWGLSSRGVAVLRYDSRAFAHPFDLTRHGDAVTVDHMITDDAIAAAAVLRAHDKVDAGRVFVVGHGLGGKLAPRIAERVAPALAGTAVLAAPARSRPEILLAQSRHKANEDGSISAEEQAGLDQIEHAVGSWQRLIADPDAQAPSILMFGEHFNYWKNLYGYDPPATAAAQGLPILVAHGGRDQQATPAEHDLWRDGLRGHDGACTVMFEGLDHQLRPATPAADGDGESAEPIAPEVIALLAGWVADGVCSAQ